MTIYRFKISNVDNNEEYVLKNLKDFLTSIRCEVIDYSWHSLEKSIYVTFRPDTDIELEMVKDEF